MDIEKVTDKYADMPRNDRSLENRFSHWFSAIKDCGIPVPKSFVFKTPVEIVKACFMESAGDMQTIQNWLDKDVMPELIANRFGNRRVFVKNAVFSNKFYADGSCVTGTTNLAQSLVHVNQSAMEHIMGYDGTDELIIRDFITYNPNQTACIYHGLPFRTEYRVFYDFDEHKGIFIQDYWDKHYVRPHLYDRTDQIVYDSVYPEIKAKYEANKDAVMTMVETAMAYVTDLHGPWSIDIMSTEREGEYYLIDMAVAEQSAYWESRPGYTAIERQDDKVKYGVTDETVSLISMTDPV